MKILENGLYNSKNNVELRTALLDAERTKTPVKFYNRSRRQITQFTCIDSDLPPFVLTSFVVSGGLVYYKKNRFEWVSFSTDDIEKIEL